jgi:hypothetical protein
MVGFCAWYRISITSFEVSCNDFCVTSEDLTDRPDLSPRAHLKDYFIQRALRWAKQHGTHARIVCSAMAGTSETSTRAIEID